MSIRKIRWFSLSFALFALSLAQEPISPEEYLQQKEEMEGSTFQVVGQQIEPAQMLELIYKCTQPAAQAAGDHLAIRGFSLVDARDYQLRGPKALGTALAKAELDAKANAAEALSAVAITASDLSTTTETTASSDSQATNGEAESVLSSFSVESIEVLKQVRSSEVDTVLIGGRVTGTGIISLGEEGMCVVVRYEVPLDQENYDPGSQLMPSDSAQASDNQEEDTQTEEGHTVPPAGSIGDF
jgi:hypothetical protein